MNAHSPLSEAPATDAPSRAEALAHGLVETRLALLGRLAEAGVEIAEQLQKQAKGETEAAVAQGDIGLCYARVARAVRLSLALQSRLVEDLKALEDDASRRAVEVEAQRDERRAGLEDARRARVQTVIARVIEAEHSDSDTVEALLEDSAERLDDGDRFDALLTRPFSEIIDLICRDIGVTPDWSRLSQEGWAQAELDSDAPGAPLAALGLPRPPRPPGAPPRLSASELDARYYAEVLRLEAKEAKVAKAEAQPPPASQTSLWGSAAAERRAVADCKRALAEIPDDDP